MKKTIDCLFIGHNEMQFDEYEKKIRSMGTISPTYRDLNLNFIQYNNKVYTASETFNLFSGGNNKLEHSAGPLNLGNLFSATIAYLGSFLSKRGLSFDFVNSFQSEKQELANKLQEYNILTIAIPTTLYVSVFPILEIVAFVKKYNENAKIIIGGPFIATQVRTQDEFVVQYLFKSINADFYIYSSQGEAALVDVIKAVKSNLPYDGVSNIFYRNSGKYTLNQVVQENNSLSENMVDWSLFNNRLGKYAAMRTSISCPFSCSFCGFPQHAGKYQTASAGDIERELDSLGDSVECINIIDDTINVPVERFKDILRVIIRKKYKFKWNCNFRCQFADREMVELMKESGCEGAFLGIESGSQQILKNMNKGATVEKYKTGIELLKEYDIITYGSFIIGFPGETRETVQETINFIEECKPTFFRTQLWYCDPFTPIWEEKNKYNIKNSQFEWIHNTMNSNIACDIIDEIFMTLKNSIWVPQFNFEFIGIFNLVHRGMTLEQIKLFINGFNTGIKERLRNPKEREISPKALSIIKESFKS